MVPTILNYSNSWLLLAMMAVVWITVVIQMWRDK